ncbi:MAG: tRNA (adenosine(37)-N6)-threonylcarbamoyltransferase complex ATPase subunit type 1 TsaE [Candidatus Andersenbacteria bacterium]
MTRTLATAAATRTLGRTLARQLAAGDVVSLEGPLGAGKTTLLQGIGAGLGIRKQLTSPTFILFRTVRLPRAVRGIRYLVHADAYRVRDPQELVAAGFLDYLGAPETLTVVEWGDRVRELLPLGTVRVQLAHRSGRGSVRDVRTVTVELKRGSKPAWRPRSKSARRGRAS